MRVFILCAVLFAAFASATFGQDSARGRVEPAIAASQDAAWAQAPKVVVGDTRQGGADTRAAKTDGGMAANDSRPAKESQPLPSTNVGVGRPESSTREAELARRVADLEKQVAELQQINKELINTAGNQSVTLGQIYRAHQELVNTVDNHSKMLGQIAAGRKSPDGKEYYVPSVSAISDDPKSRDALMDTISHDLARSSGTLEIHNDMNSGQSLVINGGSTVYVPAHSKRNVTVPSGTAMTQLVGSGEGTLSWAIGAPNYHQVVIVAPAPADDWHYDPLTGSWWRTVR
jgi:hypothetical protein